MKKSEFKIIKQLIEEEPDQIEDIKGWKKAHIINHNKDVIFVQFSGWCLTLLPNGEYFLEDTTGG